MSETEHRISGLDDHSAEQRDDRAVRSAFRMIDSPAFWYLGMVETGNLPNSLATCEKVPTSSRTGDLPETGDDLERTTDAREAVMLSISRSRERQRKVLALIDAGEVAHAKRLAACNRKSVELECSGWDGCGATNYVPISCNSRLCSDCMNEKMGQVAGQYRETVAAWDHPTMFRLSLPDLVEPGADSLERAVDALRGAFGRLRRRKVSPNGSHQNKRWVWSVAQENGEPADHYWKPALIRAGRRDLAERWERKYVSEGRGIPFEEIVSSGFYGIDIKQKEDGRLNVHAHVLGDCPYLPQAALASLWDDLIGAPVVDVRRVEERGEQGTESALMEVVGYAAKPPEYEETKDEVTYLQTLKGTKLLQPFGELHGNTPDRAGELFCQGCERSPARHWNVEWKYEGVVKGRYSTALVGSPDGDRPPPGE